LAILVALHTMTVKMLVGVPDKEKRDSIIREFRRTLPRDVADMAAMVVHQQHEARDAH